MSMLEKREKLEKRMYLEIHKGNYDKADKIRKQLVELDVKNLEIKLKII